MEQTLPVLYDISGTVQDATPETRLESFAELEAAESEKEFEQILEKMLGSRPPAHVVVTLKRGSETRTTVTDSEGKFKFIFDATWASVGDPPNVVPAALSLTPAIAAHPRPSHITRFASSAYRTCRVATGSQAL